VIKFELCSLSMKSGAAPFELFAQQRIRIFRNNRWREPPRPPEIPLFYGQQGRSPSYSVYAPTFIL